MSRLELQRHNHALRAELAQVRAENSKREQWILNHVGEVTALKRQLQEADEAAASHLDEANKSYAELTHVKAACAEMRAALETCRTIPEHDGQPYVHQEYDEARSLSPYLPMPDATLFRGNRWRSARNDLPKL